MNKQAAETRVLIVEDIADVRRDLRLLLEIAGGFAVVGDAADGHEAIDQAVLLDPDVVIMDLAMPVLDGYQAAVRIREAIATCRLVALTVHSDDASREKALAAGFDAFVPKGAPLQELLGAIRPPLDTKDGTTGGIS